MVNICADTKEWKLDTQSLIVFGRYYRIIRFQDQIFAKRLEPKIKRQEKKAFKEKKIFHHYYRPFLKYLIYDVQMKRNQKTYENTKKVQ